MKKFKMIGLCLALAIPATSLQAGSECEEFNTDIPEWAEITHRHMYWRFNLWNSYRTSKIRQDIVDADECTCELLKQPWDNFREGMEALSAPYGDRRITELTNAEQDEIGELTDSFKTSSIANGFQVGQLCRSLD